MLADCIYREREEGGWLTFRGVIWSRTRTRTNSVKHSICKTSETPMCCLLGDSSNETMEYLNGCRKLAQADYRKHHCKVALRVHSELCRKYWLECTDKWYDHQPIPVTENGKVSEDNLGYDYLNHRQAAKAQSDRYYCSTQRHTGVDTSWYCCANAPKYPYYWVGEGGEVSRPGARN